MVYNDRPTTCISFSEVTPIRPLTGPTQSGLNSQLSMRCLGSKIDGLDSKPVSISSGPYSGTLVKKYKL